MTLIEQKLYDLKVRPEKLEATVNKSNFSAGLSDADDYAYKTIEEYEDLVLCKVNDAFRIGWSMARITNKQLGILAGEEEDR